MSKTLRNTTAKQVLRVTVVIELTGKDAIEHGAEAIERVLEHGTFQDAINAQAFIDDRKMVVTSALVFSSTSMPRFE